MTVTEGAVIPPTGNLDDERYLTTDQYLNPY